MFAAVKLIHCEGKAPLRRKNLISSEKVSLGDDAFFFIISVRVYKGKIPYEKIKAYAGRYASSLLFPESKYKAVSELDEIRLLHNSVNFLSRSDEAPANRSVCICDIKGLFCDYIEKLVPLASAIHVICVEKEKYVAVSEKLLREYGAVISVSDSWNAVAESCSNVITEKSDILPLGYKGRVFTVKKRTLPFADFVIGEGIKLPEKYERLIPEGIDPVAFAEALYSRCGIKELSECPYESYCY